MKKRKNYKKIRLSFVFILIFIFGFFYLAYFYHYEKINIEPAELKLYLTPYLENKNPITIYPALKLILKDFPQILRIKATHNIFRKEISLKITQAILIAKICDLKKCFYLDNHARIIDVKKDLFTNKQLLEIKSYLDIKNNSNLHPLLKNALLNIFEFANYFGISLKEIKIYSNFDLGVIDNKNREFLFDPHRDMEEQIKKFYLFIEKIKNDQAQRIDLRIYQKIYFK